MSEYPYLKMALAKKEVSLGCFITELLLKAIEELEDELLAQKVNKRLESMKPEDLISWDEA